MPGFVSRHSRVISRGDLSSRRPLKECLAEQAVGRPGGELDLGDQLSV